MDQPLQITRKDVLGLKFVCPACRQKMDAGREMFGEPVECPSCGRRLQVPDVKDMPRSFAVKRLSTGRRAPPPPPPPPSGE